MNGVELLVSFRCDVRVNQVQELRKCLLVSFRCDLINEYQVVVAVVF